jgi:hypothetical protein
MSGTIRPALTGVNRPISPYSACANRARLFLKAFVSADFLGLYGAPAQLDNFIFGHYPDSLAAGLVRARFCCCTRSKPWAPRIRNGGHLTGLQMTRPVVLNRPSADVFLRGAKYFARFNVEVNAA